MKTIYALFVLFLLLLNTRANENDWFVELDGTNDFFASRGVSEVAVEALKEAQKENVELKSFAFTPAGDWIAIGRNCFWSDDEGSPVSQKLKLMRLNNVNTKCVAFSPAGLRTILSNWNGFWMPDGGPAWNKISEVAHNGSELRCVVYGPDDSWVVLYKKTAIGYGGIPTDLAKVLDNAVSNNIAVQCIAFSGRDWICLAQDDWWTSDTNLPAAKMIDQKFKSGQHPKWIAFVPSYGPFNAHKFGAIIRQTLSGKLTGGYACEVIANGKVVVSLAEGWARTPWEPKDPSVKWTIDKPMEIASVSKTITATALLKLWAESQLTDRRFSLDDPFWPYLKNICPDVSDDVKTITIRQLLMHRSGFAKKKFDRRDISDVRQCLILPLAHPPGTVYLYQNLNYSIIRFLIEQISQEDYTTYVKTHVLAPMGITDMETHSEYQDRTCYYGEAGTQESGDVGQKDFSSKAGPWGWYASATDLGKFLEGLRQFRVLSPATTAMMLNENLGWDEGNPWGKTGLDFYFANSEIGYFPDGVEAVLLLNCNPPVPWQTWARSLTQAWKDAHGN
jgi:CubicO group peptidase (beta-lactamase class C family)